MHEHRLQRLRVLRRLLAAAVDDARMTTGTLTWPANMYDQFAAWFTIGSIASSMKSMRGWTTIGRMPCEGRADGGARRRVLRDRRSR